MGAYKMSDREVFEQHMEQIRSKGSLMNLDREIKIREEQEFSKFVKEQLRKDREKQETIHKLMQQDYIDTNASIKDDNTDKKRKEQEQKFKETYKYFPFTGSDEVERKRHELKQTQKKEF